MHLLYSGIYDIIIKRLSQTIAADFFRRGKSELRRAGCWVIPSQGDLKESATEIYRFRFGGSKGGKAR